MTLSRIGRIAMALLVSGAMGLGMTSCGGGTIGFMWVLGSTSGQIGGFKIDNYTGNLTPTVGSPYASGGTNPVMFTLKSGGRFLYVLNAGDATGKKGTVSLFSVGGDGTLSFQYTFTSQGTFPIWITSDTGGNYLYVLDQHSPAYDGVLDLNGSITAFALDPTTGRPSLITNAQVKNAAGTQLTYFEVGKTPTQLRNSASCIYTLDSGDQTIFPYSLGTANGQLTQPTNSSINLNTQNATSVNISGSYVYVTDAGSATGGPGLILPYTQGSNCALSVVTGGSTNNLPPASYPIQTVTSAGPGGTNFLYVLNHSTAATNYANSSVSGFVVQSNGQLQQLASDTNNPYPVGSGPVCLAIDPTNQYLYTSDQVGNTVTGKRISNQNGYLTDLTRGSSFPTVGAPSCLVISANTGY